MARRLGRFCSPDYRAGVRSGQSAKNDPIAAIPALIAPLQKLPERKRPTYSRSNGSGYPLRCRDRQAMRGTIILLSAILSSSASAQERDAPPHCHVPPPFIVFFDPGSMALTPDAKRTLDFIVEANESACSWPSAVVRGHSDTRERSSISRARANVVLRYLRKRGWRIQQVHSRAFGAANLRVTTQQGVNERQNRRVEILYTPE